MDRQAVHMQRDSLQCRLNRNIRQQGLHIKASQRKINFLSFKAHKITFCLWMSGERLFIFNKYWQLRGILCLLFFRLSTVKLDSPLSELFLRYQNTVCHVHPPEQTIVSPLTPNESSFWWQNLVILLYSLTTNIFALKYKSVQRMQVQKCVWRHTANKN